ncbi:ThiF family adenylyltransferase [Chryseobacterium indologenes]|uniref:HesA/MoeB/ThiF family protein n=1 Tax=Chryseobacterium indologenes TaxID=253 RepID=UPI0023E83A5F|nr:ThiF family adenylyltransferase [Chryseobacterium indologenes]WET48156.1 ThiF family adenylyltransferase [Chryseobacterium indologenes]
MINPNYIYSINQSVDVYRIGDDILEFYFINSRRRVTLKVTLSVIEIISTLNEKDTILEICLKNSIQFSTDVDAFLNYLLNENIIYCVTRREIEKKILPESDIERYDRQLNYFDSVFHKPSYEIQKRLQNEVVLIMGAGAMGSGIAVQLVMSGIKKIILIDKGKVTFDSLQRHFSFRNSDIGRSKVDALKDYLKRLDNNLICETHQTIVDYDTSLDKWIDKSSFVINTLDEPYIGITSLKIGRICYEKKIPMFVAGGFDAHLMSTGELIIPNKTPCVDCYTSYFSEILKDWTPQYNLAAIPDTEILKNKFEVGGLASMSLFSVSYAVMTILNYFATDTASHLGRGELLFDQLEINYLNITKNPNCLTCGSAK